MRAARGLLDPFETSGQGHGAIWVVKQGLEPGTTLGSSANWRPRRPASHRRGGVIEASR